MKYKTRREFKHIVGGLRQSIKERILRFLAEVQGQYIPQSTLHKAIHASKSRVSEVLSDLERNGLITRLRVGSSKIIFVKPGIRETEYIRTGKVIRLGIVYSSEYLYLGGFAKRLRNHGFDLEIMVFKDSLEATRALATGSIDLALSPLISQLYLLPAYRTYRIITRGLKGGYRVLYRPGDNTVYSSMISTMDYLRHVVTSRKMIEAEKTIYYHGSEELKQYMKRGGFFITWHPLFKELEKQGYNELYGPEELDIGFCCSLGISNSLGKRIVEFVKKAYHESLEEYERTPDRYLEYYSLITGIPLDLLKDAVKEYSVSEHDKVKIIDEVFTTWSQNIPSRAVYNGLLE